MVLYKRRLGFIQTAIEFSLPDRKILQGEREKKRIQFSMSTHLTLFYLKNDHLVLPESGHVRAHPTTCLFNSHANNTAQPHIVAKNKTAALYSDRTPFGNSELIEEAYRAQRFD